MLAGADPVFLTTVTPFTEQISWSSITVSSALTVILSLPDPLPWTVKVFMFLGGTPVIWFFLMPARTSSAPYCAPVKSVAIVFSSLSYVLAIFS